MSEECLVSEGRRGCGERREGGMEKGGGKAGVRREGGREPVHTYCE